MRRGPASPLVTRRRLTAALGTVWLLDGALQFQPYMFSRRFFVSLLEMANMSLPGWLSRLEVHTLTTIASRPVEWNAGFATLQVCLGLGMLWRRTEKVALAASVPWALAVWLLGEGVGGLAMQGTNLLTGAPGPAALYALLALMLWPRRPEGARAVADGGLLGPRGARLAWMVVWVGTSLLWVRAVNHLAVVPGGQIDNAGDGGPAWLQALNHAAGSLVGNQGAAFATVAGVAGAAVGVLVLVGPTRRKARRRRARPAFRTRRTALVAGVAVAVFAGVVGQDLGNMFTGRGTDPGTGPLLVLMALALWPRGTMVTAAGAPPRDLATDRDDRSPGGAGDGAVAVTRASA